MKPQQATPSESDLDAVPDAADPFPQFKDSAWSKVLVLTFVIAPLLAAGYGSGTFWGVGVGWLEIGLLLGVLAFAGRGISRGSPPASSAWRTWPTVTSMSFESLRNS